MRTQSVGIIGLAALLLGGCMVGPDYTKPSAPVTPAYKEADGWKIAEPSDHLPRGQWWAVFGDPELGQLEEQVATANQNLKIAEARLREARALVRFNRAALFPTISTSVGGASVRDSANRPFLSPNASTGSSGDLLLSLDMSYEIDLWGRVRRTVAAARIEAQATAADLETAQLSLQAELAMDYFELRAADAQQQLLDETVKAFEAALQLTTNRFQGGAAPKSDVAQAQTQLDTTKAQATDVTVQRAQLEHAIATLIGKPPAAFSLPPRPLATLPPDIPVGMPSQLLERRPDIAAAERRVAEANAEIGVTKAAFYPSLTLGGTAGLESTSIASWFTWPARFFSLGPTLTQTLFDKGRRRAATDVAFAQYDATVAGYRQTVLTSFQEVEDNLAALRILSRELDEQDAAVSAAQRALSLSNDRYKAGIDSYLNVITAQATLLNNQRTAVNLEMQQMTASVELIKALGGGWNESELPSPKQLEKK